MGAKEKEDENVVEKEKEKEKEKCNLGKIIREWRGSEVNDDGGIARMERYNSEISRKVSPCTEMKHRRRVKWKKTRATKKRSKIFPRENEKRFDRKKEQNVSAPSYYPPLSLSFLR
jgi:hypothetical protein